PADVDRRALASTPTLVGRLVAVAAAVGDTGVPFIESNGEAADRERRSDRDAHLRLVAVPLWLIRGRTHGEAAGRHHHHLGACRAVLEVLGLACTRLETAPLVLPHRDFDAVAARRRYYRSWLPFLCGGRRCGRYRKGDLLLQLLNAQSRQVSVVRILEAG